MTIHKSFGLLLISNLFWMVFLFTVCIYSLKLDWTLRGARLRFPSSSVIWGTTVKNWMRRSISHLIRSFRFSRYQTRNLKWSVSLVTFLTSWISETKRTVFVYATGTKDTAHFSREPKYFHFGFHIEIPYNNWRFGYKWNGVVVPEHSISSAA